MNSGSHDCGDPACRHTTDRHTKQDLDGTLRALDTRMRWLLAGLDPAAAVHASEHAFTEAGRVLAAMGLVVRQEGTVAGLFASGGGVPKLPIDEAVVGRRGVNGDKQATRRHHGRVSQALCLWSSDVVAALATEGHPIAPGNAGENVSIAGLDWAEVRPGSRLRIGTALCELSGWALPCTKNARWFADGDFRRIDPDLRPGWSRAYATVVEDGVIRVGDSVTVEP